MNKKDRLSFWGFFLLGGIIAFGMQIAESSADYPPLKEELAHHCEKRPNFHPDCSKMHQ